MIRVQQIRLSLDEDKSSLPKKLIKRLHIPPEELLSWQICKESIDARKPENIHFMYSVDCKVSKETAVLKKHHKDVSRTPDERYKFPIKGIKTLTHRPIVVGFGPAGMFAALLLAQMGYRPLVLERGQCIEKRMESVDAFWKSGTLHPQGNVQFGEGGAGTFSDGKLTARSKDVRLRKVLEELVSAGAPDEILYEAHPHIGTDLLRDVVRNMRKEIIALGGEIRFEAKVDDILVENDAIKGVVVDNETIPCNQVIMAIGHSARDTMRLLMDRGMRAEAKGFAVGARLEHPQALINQAQYKQYANHPHLLPAEYRLTHTAQNQRGVYTFCMCPGGYVVPSTSMEEGVVVNGMSKHARDGSNANSALLVQVRGEDFDNDPRKGIAYQEDIERKAFQVGGCNYKAPAQLVSDFLRHQPSTQIGSVIPTYSLGVTLTDLHDVLPSYICEAMEEGIIAMDKKLHGFALDDAILTGVETRSSSPVRFQRLNETLQAIDMQGIYPCGEGAGYAGGIVSAAIDGLRCAEAIIHEFHEFDEA